MGDAALPQEEHPVSVSCHWTDEHVALKVMVTLIGPGAPVGVKVNMRVPFEYWIALLDGRNV